MILPNDQTVLAIVTTEELRGIARSNGWTTLEGMAPGPVLRHLFSEKPEAIVLEFTANEETRVVNLLERLHSHWNRVPVLVVSEAEDIHAEQIARSTGAHYLASSTEWRSLQGAVKAMVDKPVARIGLAAAK